MTKRKHPVDRRERIELSEDHELIKHDRKGHVQKKLLIEKEIEHGFREYLEEAKVEV